MFRFMLIILVFVWIVKQENPGLCNAKLQRKLKDIHKQPSESIENPTSKDYRRYQQEPKKIPDEYRLTLTENFTIPCETYIMGHAFNQLDFTVNFEWHRNSTQIEDDGIHMTISEVYYEFKDDFHHFTSFLSIYNMTESLYGKYLCRAVFYDQSSNRKKPQFLTMGEDVYYLRPLHWRKQARKLATWLMESRWQNTRIQILLAKVNAQRRETLRQGRRLNYQKEQFDQLQDTKEVYEDAIWKLLHRTERLRVWYEALRNLFFHLLVNFCEWVIGIVSAILVLIKIYQYIRIKLKEREMKKNYALLEKIAGMGLTFRHQCSTYDHDVFITACEEDEKFVEDELVPKIQMEWKLKKHYAEMDQRGGVDIMLDAAQKINKSKKTLVVLSLNFIQSRWSIHQLCLAYHRKCIESKDSLVILHLSDLIDNPIELEPLLQGNNYVDFREGSTEEAWNELKRVLTS